ncbi:hypothetical protein PC129_g10092 [Phytophthora cactorum]|nr:hypothetical protein PC114_g12618 [Phytophthora cactorum]KAG2942580.1 hypothetical protein PC117_g9732 [Phytophthora cactorum]KAG3009609.1 hypothetical protein PC119_g13829 [Phytophthora cactorum]KAG3014269.1 hypothetical protein PC120_g12788 [Phytophthora cactorum]KAG3080919.1 hypothetical protein PC122_g11547 [Phytophthora cactorum]
MSTSHAKKMKILWDRDGVDGGPSSMKVLLDWLTTDGNYARWKGDDGSSGSTKEVLCGIIIGKLKDAGINHRKSADVRDKIRYLEKQFRRATDWMANAGQGATDDISIRSAILQLCPCYYKLSHVMGDSPPSEPCQTTDNLDEGGDQRYKKRPLRIAEITSNKKHQKHTLWSLTDLQEPSQQARDDADTKLLELEEKRLEFEMKREAREEAQAKAELGLINAKRRSVEIDNTTRLLLSRKQLKDAGYTEEELDAHLPLITKK